MNVTIVGTGEVGRALAGRIHKSGGKYKVKFASRKDGTDLAQDSGIVVEPVGEAVAEADMVVLAIPAAGIPSFLDGNYDLTGKIVVDATNTIRPLQVGDELKTGFDLLIEDNTGAKVVKCFNCTGKENMAEPVYTQHKPSTHKVAADMFMAGDDDSAKTAVAELARTMGYDECYDVGGAANAHLLEALAKLWINISMKADFGRNFAFKLIKRE